ncbi:MAG: MlaD family protein [Cytophagales bacterium]|nr:MlaD family protein [Cytophagales bacterium]
MALSLSLSKEIKVGLLALVAGVILYFGFQYLKGTDLMAVQREYHAVYNNVSGLKKSNPVKINGVQVGKVANLTLISGNRVVVTFDIERQYRLNDSTRAIFASASALGDKEIQLIVGNGTRLLTEGDTLIGRTEPGMLDIVAEQAKPIVRDLDTMLVNINTLVKQMQKLSQPLGGTLQNLQSTSGKLDNILAQNQAAIRGIANNLNSMSAALNDPQTGVKPLMAKLNAAGDTLSQMQLAETVQKANASIANINKLLGDINQGQGSLGKLAKNDSLYNNLNRFSANLDSLMVDFRQRPKRYVHFSVFGRKDKEKKK